MSRRQMQDHLVVHPLGELHPLRRAPGAGATRTLRSDAARMSACCSAVKPFCSGGTDGAGAKPAVARRNVAATSARPVCRAAVAWPGASRPPLMNNATAIAVAARTSDPPAMSATVTGLAELVDERAGVPEDQGAHCGLRGGAGCQPCLRCRPG